ncbi:MAG: hypothetical protein CR991_01355 [Proteobacteria bacterium]|nr:MAG: hypothetical protein CR991_01355 [Pseudomonadota bacterium]
MSHRTFRGVRFIVAALLLVGSSTTHATLVLDQSASANTIQTAIQGPGLTLENVKITKGVAGQYGLFSDTNKTVIGISNGLFMTTGRPHSILPPNDKADYTYNTGVEHHDTDLKKLAANAVYDPVIIEFDIIPQGDLINFLLVFGSDEYPEYVCSQYNDAFGLFVSGPGWTGTRNAAFLPGTTQAITVNNINAGQLGVSADGHACSLNNAMYFIDNSSGTILTQMDGFSRPMTTTLDKLQPGQRYKVKLALADTGDQAYDSSAFFRWLTSTDSTQVDLALNTRASTLKPEKGGYLDVSYTVKNNSPSATKLVKVGIELPDGLRVVSSDAGSAFNANTGIWDVGNVAAQGSRSIKLRLQIGNASIYNIPAEILYAFNEDPNSTPFNRQTHPSENDTAFLSLTPISNKAPSINSSNRLDGSPLSIPENTTGVLLDVNATDLDGETEGLGLVWSLEGSDASAFYIDQKGRISPSTTLDYEKPVDQNKNNLYELTYKVCDSYHSCASESLTIQVTDVNEDADGDGLLDNDERSIGTDPFKQDSDGDGLSDKQEVGTDLTHPQNSDHDDKIDALDIDDDNDGLMTLHEIGSNASSPIDTDHNGIPNYLDPDDDGDGILTKLEEPDSNGDGDPVDARDTDNNATPDYLDINDDGDSKLTKDEWGSDPNNPQDSDGDDIPDYLDADDNDGAAGDHDKDGLTNAQEAALGTNPNNPDTDGDGILDGVEIGTNTNKPQDTDKDNIINALDPDDDNDGILSRFEVGTDPNKPVDTDQDQQADYLDMDDDNDSILTKDEAPDADNNGNPDDARDTDKDTIPDYLDPDDDGDSIATIQEANRDDDLDEIPDHIDPEKTPYIHVRLRAILQGAYDEPKKLMNTKLVQQGLLPKTQPYGSIYDAMGYTNSSDFASPFGHKGKETLSDAVLNATGGDALVDWVLIEIRDKNNPAKRLASKAAVLQSDGDIVDAETGSMELLLHNVETGKHYVAIDHRNHLGIMTAQPVHLAPKAQQTPETQLYDFTRSNTATYGNHARIAMKNGVQALIAGDINHSNSVVLKGAGSDTNVIQGVILLVPANSGTNSSYKLQGYYSTDVNLDGETIYAGVTNDINLIKINILQHPNNTRFSNDYTIMGTLPTYR